MSRLPLESDRVDLQNYIVQSHHDFEQEQCLNCIHYSDGCCTTDKRCPGHAVTE